MKNFIVFFIVFVCCAFTNNLLCQTPVINEDFTLIANDGASYDHYGTCVSVFSSIAVVGSPDDNNSTGAAYVYIFNNQTNTWEFEVKLTASDGVQGDEFGRQVCIYKDYIIVGAHLHSHNGNSEAGKAYIYNPYGFGNWSEQILTASNASSGDHFGRAVSIYGNYAIVGAKDKNNGRGSAYIFRKGINGFYQTQIIDPSNLDVNDNFGQAVSINDNYAIISAMYDDGINNSNTNCGCAYIYKFDVFSWVYVSKLYASDCSANDWFGNAVSIDRKSPTVVIGSMMENSHGSAYVFAGNGTNWYQKAKLMPDNGGSGDHFGGSVGISGTDIVIGADNNNHGGTNAGLGYLYQHDGLMFNLTNYFEFSNISSADWFGRGVAIYNNIVMIGASSRDNYPLTDDGAAYMFSLPTNKSKSLSSNSYLLADDFEIIISPNPFYNSINLKSNCVMDYTSIYDITGKLIKKDVCNSSEFNLNLNSLKAGTYILKTYCGKNNYTRKIVKLD